MIRKGYFLSQIAEIVPWVTKADIYGLSHMIHKPMELTKEDLREVELEYRKTGEPAVLKKIFGEPDQNKEGKSVEQCYLFKTLRCSTAWIRASWTHPRKNDLMRYFCST